jgi:2-hydroxy-6-oxonona-2,4-dienedioate hydrolase
MPAALSKLDKGTTIVSIWTDLRNLPFQQAFYDAKGIRTRVIEAGGGEALIFLHGTGGHAEAFTRNIAPHAKHFRTIAMDMIGHGYTDAPDVPYTMELLVDHLRDTIDALGLKSVSLCGESLGAMVAAHYAIRYPDRVKKLVMNTGMLMRRREEDKPGLRDLLERTRRATGELTREAVRARLAWLMYEPEKSVTDELVDVRYAVYTQPARAAIISRITQLIAGGLLDDAWVEKYSNPDDMRGIACPVLVMWTRHNPGLTVENAETGMKEIADARMVVFENSGHWPQWEESERYNKIHLDFLTAATVGAR